MRRFTVRIGLRPDNPAFPVYLVFLGERLIGKQFSVPTQSDCEWLMHQHDPVKVCYAKSTRYGRVGKFAVACCGRCGSTFRTNKLVISNPLCVPCRETSPLRKREKEPA